MHIVRATGLLVFVSVLLSCGTDTPTAPLDLNYPTTIHALSQQDLDDLKREFARSNPELCSSLNAYGFTYGRCSKGIRGLPSDPIDQLVQAARSAIRDNSKFTGVQDTSDLMLSHTGGSPSRIRVHFSRQQYQGLLVEHTYISVDMDSLGIFSIHGNHYPEIYVPSPRISRRAAQRSILGMEITWYDIGGQPHTFIVTWDHLEAEPTTVVLPIQTEEYIELRVTWRVPIGLGWWAHVDTVTGENLAVWQLFVT